MKDKLDKILENYYIGATLTSDVATNELKADILLLFNETLDKLKMSEIMGDNERSCGYDDAVDEINKKIEELKNA